MHSIQGSTSEVTAQDETTELLEESALTAPVSGEGEESVDAGASVNTDASTAVEASEVVDATVLEGTLEVGEAAKGEAAAQEADGTGKAERAVEGTVSGLDGVDDEADDAGAPETAEPDKAGEAAETAPVVSAGITEEVAQPSMGEMGELPVEDWDYQRPKRGQIRTGVILSIHDQEIIVDVDAKRDGIVPYADMQRLGAEELAALSPGDEVDVFILRPEDQDGNLLVSIFQARQSKAWETAAELAESGEVWEGQVEGYNKGGLVVPVGDIRGFVPASQVPGFPQGLGQDERLRRLSALVGENLMVKVIEINRRNRRLILSATAARREWRQVQRERLVDELREGEVRPGTVSSLCAFGAFVDLGGADGLVHLSELSWRRVRHPREVVRVGQKVEVYVLRLDSDRNRIGLSLKRLQPEPWALVEDKYELGQLVEGLVTNVTDFGAFAEIEAGVEGLIHVSELTDGTISHPRDVVKKGDLLLLRIIRIDIRRKRLGLSLKRVLESEWAEWAAQLAVEAEEDETEQEPDGDVPFAEPVAAEEPDPSDAVEPADEAGESEPFGGLESPDEKEPGLALPDALAEVEEMETLASDEAGHEAVVLEVEQPSLLESAGGAELSLDTPQEPVEEQEPPVLLDQAAETVEAIEAETVDALPGMATEE